MFTVRLAITEEEFPWTLRIELKGLGVQPSRPGEFHPEPLPLYFDLPKPGRTLMLTPFTTPSAKFKLNVNYYLDDTRVGVELSAARDKDLLTIFASRYQSPKWNRPGVLYVATVFHGDGQKQPCEVKCEEGNMKLEECCVICEKDNVIVETCC